jgi:WD40 repeat protein
MLLTCSEDKLLKIWDKRTGAKAF